MMWVALAVGVLLSAAAALTLVRVVRGPNTLDRLVAVDLLVALAMCGLATYSGVTGDSTAIPAVVALTIVGFVGSVSVARFRVPDRT